MPRILVADDNTNIQKMVSLAFEERGIDVVSVGNGEAAVRRIPDLNPDLVLADVFMPVRNGYEVCEFVKKDDRFSHVPVILLVGAFDPLDEKEARRVGADGVLKKPFVPPDPLIAMVTSALEKNPKVAAEMAKAREAAAAPPPPEPIAPVLEAPARIEPKPLPEFPEPTPEEAAQIYGFGKGVRSADDEATPEDGREGPKSLKAPKASSKKKHEEEDDDDDDDAMTAHDWRRNAGDFEVPDEPGGRLAFTPDEAFGTTFPSERDVPPRHIPMPDDTETDSMATANVRGEEFEANAIQEVNSAPSVEPEPVTAISGRTEAQSAPLLLPSPPAKQTEPEPAFLAQDSASSSVDEPAVAQAPTPASTESSEEIPHAPKSKIGAWMDMMASPSEYSEGGWLSSIFGHKTQQKQKQEGAEEAPPEPISAQPLQGFSTPSESSASIQHFEDRAEDFTAATRATPPAALSPALSAPELKADEPESVPESPEPDSPEPESWFAPPPPPVLRDVSESAPLLALANNSTTDSAFIAPPPEVTGSRRDPAFEEPASAARVVREPLLVQDDAEPSSPSRFSRGTEQPSPLHSFFAPASGDPVADEPAHDDPAHHEEFNTSIFAVPDAKESSTPETSERIPTGPPPNREALSDIPFLMPPPPSPFESSSQSQSNSPAQVDAVVAKVLEKLQPQLHQLLSQSLLKPLVENLLQQELEKKEK